MIRVEKLLGIALLKNLCTYDIEDTDTKDDIRISLGATPLDHYDYQVVFLKTLFA